MPLVSRSCVRYSTAEPLRLLCRWSLDRASGIPPPSHCASYDVGLSIVRPVFHRRATAPPMPLVSRSCVRYSTAEPLRLLCRWSLDRASGIPPPSHGASYAVGLSIVRPVFHRRATAPPMPLVSRSCVRYSTAEPLRLLCRWK